MTGVAKPSQRGQEGDRTSSAMRPDVPQTLKHKHPAALPVPYVDIISKRRWTEYEIAKARLLSASSPSLLPCRERELEDMTQYLRSAITHHTGCGLYVSGVPGTGKTATVHEAIRRLRAEADKGDAATAEMGVPPFCFIEINGLKLADPKQAYVALWRELRGDPALKISPAKALDHLEQYFGVDGPKPKQMNVVLMDELDVLINRSQSVIYNFFDWPHRHGTSLILIAIANTMDLPERLLSNKVTSRIGLKRVNFQPYTHPQLGQILLSRLDPAVFHKDALELCARKVSAVSGDARKALDICRRAIEIAESRSRRGDRPSTPGLLINMDMILTAIKEMYISAGMATLQRASFHQRLFVVSLAKCCKRDVASEASLEQVVQMHGQLCRVHGLDVPEPGDFLKLAHHLYDARCISVETGACIELFSKLKLALNEDDVQRTLSSGSHVLAKMLSL